METSILSGEMRYKIIRFISDEAWILAHMRKTCIFARQRNGDNPTNTIYNVSSISRQIGTSEANYSQQSKTKLVFPTGRDKFGNELMVK